MVKMKIGKELPIEEQMQSHNAILEFSRVYGENSDRIVIVTPKEGTTHQVKANVKVQKSEYAGNDLKAVEIEWDGTSVEKLAMPGKYSSVYLRITYHHDILVIKDENVGTIEIC